MLDALKDSHAAYLDELSPMPPVPPPMGGGDGGAMPIDDDAGLMSPPTPPLSTHSGSTSSAASRRRRYAPSSSTASYYSASARAMQPQFNVDSAADLLGAFQKALLPHFPCIVLSSPSTTGDDDDDDDDDEAEKEGEEEVTVASLARTRPFVLLAILSAASGSRTLQGHSLYDEEFRKILGLKFVAGGERTLELLLGLLIYCAW